MNAPFMVPPLSFVTVQTTDEHTQALDTLRLQTPGLGLLPIKNHPGAFGVGRQFHRHEGVDLYTQQGAPVYSVAEGVVLGLYPFTGEHAGSPWWEETWCVMVRHVVQGHAFCLNYGEIVPVKGLQAGQAIGAGAVLGHVSRVLKKDKGRPTTMLHLEQYTPDMVAPVKEWPLGHEKPAGLLDPTTLLKKLYFPTEPLHES